ncbi:MAG: UDP-N-acetylglucosamine diphosphorylase [Verrucomicrobia bacterium]|nr:UDP-N-acetylglucosamine diphosphorylase [Verrucomicrobiota bacterium]
MTQALTHHHLFSLEQFAHRGLFEGCEYPWHALDKLSSYLKEQKLGTILGEVSPNAHLVNSDCISIGEGTVVEPGAYIEGPCILGRNCTVRHGAYIRGNVLVGDGCVIGHGTEVKHSIFLNGAAAPHFNYVGDSIIGCDVNLGAGVKCANLRLDHLPISIRFEEHLIPTQRKKLGAIVGDGAQVGCNCVLAPGTILGKKAICFPCLSVQGTIPDGTKVKPALKNIFFN